MNQIGKTISILHLEDSDLDGDLVEAQIKRHGITYATNRVWSREDFISALEGQTFDLILADYKLPAFDGLKALEIARDLAPETPFIFVSATLGEEVAIESLKNGATDYVIKSRLARLGACIERALAERAEIAARRKAEDGAYEARQRLSAALTVAQIGSFEWRCAAEEIVLDDRACKIFGLPPSPSISTATFRDLMMEQDRMLIAEAFMAAREERRRVEGDFRVRLPNGLTRYVAAVCDWFTDPEGEVIGIGVFQDITARKRAEEEQKLVVRELHHRVKNSLATVQAVVTFSLRHAKSLDGFRDTIYQRIDALARSHSLLTDDEFGGLLLRDMLTSELGAYDDGVRVTLQGPPVYLNTDFAMTFSLAVHELSTNAAKYGALSNASGRIDVSWDVRQGDRGRTLTLNWQETGGPKIEAEPDHKGFGSVLIHRLLGGLPGAQIDLNYPPEGLKLTLSLDLPVY